MKMQVNVILSAELPARTPADDVRNAKRTNRLHDELNLRGITFMPARGCYKGVEERSVVALVTDSEDYDWLIDLAFGFFQQESVMVVDRNYVARLVYRDGSGIGRVDRIGLMEKVPEAIARSRDGWTRLRRSLDVTTPFEFWTVNRDSTPTVEALTLGEAERFGIPEVH